MIACLNDLPQQQLLYDELRTALAVGETLNHPLPLTEMAKVVIQGILEDADVPQQD